MGSGGQDFNATESSKPSQVPSLRFWLEAPNTFHLHNLRLHISYFANYSFCFTSLAGQFLPGITGTDDFINTLFLFWYRVSGGLPDHRHYGGVLLHNFYRTPYFLG